MMTLAGSHLGGGGGGSGSIPASHHRAHSPSLDPLDASGATSSHLSPSTSEESDLVRGWRSRKPSLASAPSARPSNLPKIKSSPGGHGALAAARQTAAHGKLHRRAGSTSAVAPSPTPAHAHAPAPASATDPRLSSTFTYTHPTSPQRSSPEPHPLAALTSPASTASSSRTKTKIKPLLRKLTTPEDSNSLDLSRSAADNDGLGIYAADADALPFASPSAGASHIRSASGASQFSTTTTASGGRQYVHPMRQTPRPYTPPIAQSYQSSALGSDLSADGAGPGSDEEERLRRILRDASHRGPRPRSPPSRPPRIQTDLSSAGLLDGSRSQTSLAGTPPSARARADALSPADTASRTSRGSMEGRYGKRSRTISDPVAVRAAEVRAARQAFNDREAAKARKAELDELRAREREARRRSRPRGRRSLARDP
ncbi:MAG: hypothetical protein M1832_004652, partial [Thelocarpon impressellum]